MPFVQARCVNCNGTLEVDSSQRAAICPYCGTPYVVEDAINHYHNHIEHLHADVVNMVDEHSSESRLKAGDTFMTQKRFDSAKQAYIDASNIAPQNYLSWWGQIRAITQDFSLKPERFMELDNLQQLFDSALLVAPADKKKEIQSKYNTYYKPLRQKTDAECAALEKKISLLRSQEVALQNDYNKNNPRWTNPATGLPNWVGGILAVILLVGIIRIFAAGAPAASPLVIIPVVVWLADKIICFIYNQCKKATRARKVRTQERILKEMNRIGVEKRRAEDRLHTLKR